MKELTAENFDAFIQQGKCLVDFWAPWCGPCRMQAPILEELDTELKNAAIGKLNVDDEQELATRFQVMSIPTLILFENGREKARYIGVQPKEKLKAALA